MQLIPSMIARQMKLWPTSILPKMLKRFGYRLYSDGLKLVKLYIPAVALGTLSIASILASNNILRKRNVALAAAYATVDKTFKEYRNRVIERFGDQDDKELRYNIKAKRLRRPLPEKTEKKRK